MTAPASAAVSETQHARTIATRRTAYSRLQERFTRATGFTATGVAMIVVGILFWITARFVAGRPLYLISYGMFLFVGAAKLIGRRPLPLEGKRSDGRARLREGEVVDMEVGLTATRRLSTFILEERIPEGLGDSAQIPIASLEAGENVGHSYQLTCNRRGVYNLGPLVAKWGDPFGLTQREAVLADPFEMLVHPGVEYVQDRPLTRQFEDPPIRPPVSKPWPTGFEFYGMHEYAPGDDIRRVVWRAFARTGQLLVREAEQGITDKITIVLDTNREYHSAGEVSVSFEQAVKACASLASRHLKDGYGVTVIANSGPLLPPLRGWSTAVRMLDSLARVELENVSLADSVMGLVNSPSRDNHIIIVTPRLDPEVASRLSLLVQRGASVLVAAVVWDETFTDTLGIAASLGCQVIEIRPGAPLAVSFRREVGAGR